MGNLQEPKALKAQCCLSLFRVIFCPSTLVPGTSQVEGKADYNWAEADIRDSMPGARGLAGHLKGGW